MNEQERQGLDQASQAAQNLLTAMSDLQDKLVDKQAQEKALPTPHIGDIVIIWGRAWKLKSMKPREVRLKLLPNSEQAKAMQILQANTRPGIGSGLTEK